MGAGGGGFGPAQRVRAGMFVFVHGITFVHECSKSGTITFPSSSYCLCDCVPPRSSSSSSPRSLSFSSPSPSPSYSNPPSPPSSSLSSTNGGSSLHLLGLNACSLNAPRTFSGSSSSVRPSRMKTMSIVMLLVWSEGKGGRG